MTTTEIVEIIKFTLPIVLAILAIFQYWSANAFKRVQFLSELWGKFYKTEKFVLIFDALDRNDKVEFDKISTKDLYAYLAFLEEIAIFSRTNNFQFYKLKNSDLINLFQFHFYNIYCNENSKNLFWTKILESNFINVDEKSIQSEISQKYWRKQYQFALKCKANIN
jgi:hypothetical protein